MELDKKDFVILTLIANHSKTSLTAEEINDEVSKRFDINITELLDLLKNYEKKGLIKNKTRGLNPGYFMEEKESKLFDKKLRKLKQSDFLDYLTSSPTINGGDSR